MTTTILEHDRSILAAIAPRLDSLWKPLRFLADLERVWPELSEEERREIAASRPYRDQFHRRLAEEQVGELLRLADDLHAPDHRELREALRSFLEQWEVQEPDQAKVLSAMVRQAGG